MAVNDKKDNYKVLGILIRSNRISKGYSLRELASITKISHTLISNIEKGQLVPAPSTLSDIFKALDLVFYDDESLSEEFSRKAEIIRVDLYNQEYEDAFKIFKTLMEKEEKFMSSIEVVNYFLLKCLYFSLVNQESNCVEEELDQYEAVLQFFTDNQQQLYHFIRGLNHLNNERWNRATAEFNRALSMGTKELDVFIKEYNIQSLVRQYKFMDAYRYSQQIIKEFEDRTIYIRAMKTKLQIARILYHIAKNDETIEIVNHVERFGRKYNVVELIEDCIMMRAAIKIRLEKFDEAEELLQTMPDPKSISCVLLRFKIAFILNDLERMESYFNEIKNFESIQQNEKVFLYIEIRAMSKIKSLFDKKSYLEKLERLTEIASTNMDQEMIGLAHNYLIMFYHEERQYKKALEIAESLLHLKKITIDFRKDTK